LFVWQTIPFFLGCTQTVTIETTMETRYAEPSSDTSQFWTTEEQVSQNVCLEQINGSPINLMVSSVAFSPDSVSSTSSESDSAPMSEEPSCETYDTDVTRAFEDWSWYKQGGSRKVKLEGSECKRQWYCCSSKQSGCQAKLVTVFGPSTSQIEGMGQHNHLPPKKIRLSPETRELSRVKLATNAKISKVHQNLTLTQPPTPRSLPTPKQLQQIRSYERSKTFPSKDSLQNLRAFHPNFVQEVTFIPSVRIIMVNPELLAELKTRTPGYADGTFNIVEENLTLTTIIYEIHGFGIPLAHMFHSVKTEKIYKEFFSFLTEFHQQLRPTVLLGDFEKALRNASNQSFRIPFYGDFFHLIQANVRWMKKNQPSLVKAVVKSVRALFNTETKPEFDTKLIQFKLYWSTQCAAFLRYFEFEWLTNTDPSIWSRYTRQSVPSGDGILEGWHHRIKTQMNSFNLPLDRAVQMLYDKSRYWLNVLRTPHLKEAHHIELKRRKEKWEKYSFSQDLLSSDSTSFEISKVNVNKLLPTNHQVMLSLLWKRHSRHYLLLQFQSPLL